MNKGKTVFHISLFFFAIARTAHGQLLLDRFVTENPAGAINWTNAGVKEDLSNAAIGSIGGSANGVVFRNISHLSAIEAGADNLARPDNPNFGGIRFPGNPLLNSYAWFTTQRYELSISGFVDDDGNPNTLTTTRTAPFASVRDNTFTLEPNQAYRLYLFGVGYRDGQNTTFIFMDEPKMTNPSGDVVDTAEDAHFVTFDFTTPADLTGWKLEFEAVSTDLLGASMGANGAFNGLALVPLF